MSLSLKVSHIAKSYDGRRILRNCSFTFDENVIYSLTGPNGCGKSTLLRICALVETPDEGEIIFCCDGRRIVKDLSLRRRITLVFPRAGIFNTTTFRNAAYGLIIRGKRAMDKVKEALDFVGLGLKSDQNALTLSSGETQRLNIARALVINPEILFLDEPTASVDQANSEIIENIIVELKKEHKTTIIMTTHDKKQAERLADRNLVLQDGVIVEE